VGGMRAEAGLGVTWAVKSPDTLHPHALCPHPMFPHLAISVAPPALPALPEGVADVVPSEGGPAPCPAPRLRTASSGIVDPSGLGVCAPTPVVDPVSPAALALGRPWVPVDVVIVVVSVLTVACGLGVAWFNYLIPEGALTSWSWMFVLMLPQVWWRW
jgi:hypothetical protein